MTERMSQPSGYRGETAVPYGEPGPATSPTVWPGKSDLLEPTLPVSVKDTSAKAIVAACSALSVAIAAALADGQVTVWEIVLGVLGAIVAGGLTYSVSNRPAQP